MVLTAILCPKIHSFLFGPRSLLFGFRSSQYNCLLDISFEGFTGIWVCPQIQFISFPWYCQHIYPWASRQIWFPFSVTRWSKCPVLPPVYPSVPDCAPLLPLTILLWVGNRSITDSSVFLALHPIHLIIYFSWIHLLLLFPVHIILAFHLGNWKNLLVSPSNSFFILQSD